VQNDVNVMEANCEERRMIRIRLEIFHFVGEIGRAQEEMWIFAERQERGYCSVVSSPEDKGVRDIVDLSAVHLDHI